jgi:hypothetical protein
MANVSDETKRYLVASDFDQTLSFNDSGQVLSELVGIAGFEEKVTGLANSNLVQQGAELAYLLRHDPEFRSVRKEHLMEADKRVRLKNNVNLLADCFKKGLANYSFQFYVISASPQDVVIAPGHVSNDAHFRSIGNRRIPLSSNQDAAFQLIELRFAKCYDDYGCEDYVCKFLP